MKSPPSNNLPKFAISTTKLTRQFGPLTAIDHIEFRVPYKEIFGLLGSNGAGKSTLIKMLTTLLPPTSGSAEVGGYDIIKAPAEVRRHIGYVSQLLSADGALTGYENLLLSAKLYGLKKAERTVQIRDALDFMKLAESAKKLVKTYSGGMVHKPAILFLDEPTIGLDPIARHMVWDRLQDLRHKYGMTVLITTHDMEEAETLCDQLAILHSGRINIVGKPSELCAELGVNATMDDVFAHYAGGLINEAGSYKEIGQTRLTAHSLG